MTDKRIAFIGIATVLVLCLAARASAQSDDPVFDAKGFQENRDYFSRMPFENVDTATGNLLLAFTDLVLPGNGGHDLRFQRTFNTKGDVGGDWTFGLAGIVFRITDPNWPDNLGSGGDVWPTLYTVDGGGRTAVTQLVQTLSDNSNFIASRRVVMTDRFWKYDRTDRVLWMPDGSTSQYDASGQLSWVKDAFDNVVLSVSWSPQQVTVTQHLGDADRVVELALPGTPNCKLGMPACLPTSMSYGNRVWTYGADVVSPEGVTWGFSSEPNLISVTTPYGGQIRYTLETKAFPTETPQTFAYSQFVTQRIATDPRGQSTGTWTYEYTFPTPGYSTDTVVTDPDGTVTRFYYRYPGPVWNPSPPGNNALGDYPGRAYLLKTRIVEKNGIELEREERDYTWVPIASWNSGDMVPELGVRTVTRAGSGQAYTTTFQYNNSHFYGDYHNPVQILESGHLQRTTTSTYAHSAGGPSASPFVGGRRTSQHITAGGETYKTAWGYDANDGWFNTSMTVNVDTPFEIATQFTNDGLGNVASATTAGKTTTHTYQYGREKNTVTPEYTIVRAINPDGTVASETTANRTTTYLYDNLSRVKRITPPQGANNPPAPTDITYETASVVVDRGRSRVITMLDGFGRPIETIDAVNVRTRTEYDAEGRTRFQSLPYDTGSGNAGTRFTYDGLGRLTREEHLGGTSVPSRSRTYIGNTVTVTDENNNSTQLVYSAFGNPDDARLTSLVDARQQTWNYGYNGLGQLGSVAGPGGATTARTWTYHPGTDLLYRETHPESGTVTYELYEDGVLKRKRDANNTLFAYTHDNNDRLRTITATSNSQPTQVTTITYEPGSDNRASMSVTGGASTEFSYDPSGRLRTRRDTVDGRQLTTAFDYFRNNNVGLITYPSGRQVAFTYDAEGRVTNVRNHNTNTAYASSISYHPSGALKSYQAGNDLTTTVDLDPARQWVASIQTGSTSLMRLNYTYDNVGNVRTITEPSRPEKNQTFTYDQLDRLSTAENAPTFTMGFAYDAHGNRLTANGTTYEYHANRPFHLRSMGSLSPMEYDANGNLISGPGGVALTYSLNNLVTSATGSATSEYAYDADDWRVKRRVNGATYYSVRGPNGMLLSEWRNELPKAIVKDYIYAGSRLIAVETSNTLDVLNP